MKRFFGFCAAALLTAMALAGCGRGRREPPPRATETAAPPISEAAPDAETAAVSAPAASTTEKRRASVQVEPFGGAAARAAADHVTFKPHPRAATLVEFEEGWTPAESERAAMIEAADRFLLEEVPDFVIKDFDRPWLDRRYTPTALRVARGAENGVEAAVTLHVTEWDEGERGAPRAMELRLRWREGAWDATAMPDEYRRDLAHALATLSREWGAGERTFEDGGP